MAFPTLFPDGKGDPTSPNLNRDVPFNSAIKHLLKFGEFKNGQWNYRFAKHPRFSYWALNMIQRKRTLQQGSIFIKQNPGDSHFTIEEMREMASSNPSTVFMSKLSRYVANITGSNAYWHKVRNDLKTIITTKGVPTIFFTLSSADMHWPELHSLFSGKSDSTNENRRQNVIDNPHIVDWFFDQHVKSFIKHWLYDTLGASWHWYRYEYQARGSIHCHGTAKLKNDPGLCELTEIALKGYIAEQNLKLGLKEVNQADIENGKLANMTVCNYVDSLLTTWNPQMPPDSKYIKPSIHPCRQEYLNISHIDYDCDYVNLLNAVQRHTRCSTNYCLRRKQNESDLKCRFNFPFELCDKTKLEFEKVNTKDKSVQYRAKIITKRNDSRVNNHPRMQLQGWRANCDIQIIIDHHACVEYLAKYATKGEPRSQQLKHAFNAVINDPELDNDSVKATKRLMMKSIGERDFSAQETMHQLLSLNLHSSTFKVKSFNLNGSRRVQTHVDKGTKSGTKDSFLDIYAQRKQFVQDLPDIMSMNFLDFATHYKVTNGKLQKQPDNIVPIVFPEYSPNPKGQNFSMFCKFQLLKYKPWENCINDIWGNLNPDDQMYITEWHNFLQTPICQKTC